MQQWDQLLEIAQQFAAIEVQLGPDTSEEEILREDFIDDSEARFVAVVRWPGTFRLLMAMAVLLRSTIQCLTRFRKTYQVRMGETIPNRDTFHIHNLGWLRRESG